MVLITWVCELFDSRAERRFGVESLAIRAMMVDRKTGAIKRPPVRANINQYKAL